MRNVGYFEKVSFDQFKRDTERLDIYTKYTEPILKALYDEIELPCRATKGSAGYDFFFPYNKYVLSHGESIVIPTGIKVKVIDEWFLGLFPKSSFGNEYRIKLDDTVSVIDSDYYNCERNEGHIIVKMTNNDKKLRPMPIYKGQGYCQGVFLEYGIVDNDNATGIRVGGFGSTTKIKEE